MSADDVFGHCPLGENIRPELYDDQEFDLAEAGR